MVCSGATVIESISQFVTLTPTDLVNLPTSHWSNALPGASSTGRPVDPSSFTFNQNVVDGMQGNATEDVTFSVPYLVFSGLPTSAQIAFEAIFNLEGTQVIQHSILPMIPDSDISAPALCDYFPSFEAMHRKVVPLLPAPGRPGEATASSDASFMDTIWSAVKGVGSAVGQRLLDYALPPKPLQVQFGSSRGNFALPSNFGGYLT
jgi:hypothetical protein